MWERETEAGEQFDVTDGNILLIYWLLDLNSLDFVRKAV